MLPFLPCGQAYRFRLRLPKVRLALVQISLTCIPSQNICDSDPKIFDTYNVFEGIYKAWMFWPLPCYFWKVEISHTPFPCPASQLIYIFLKFQCVLCILNFSVTNIVIRKESYFKINVCFSCAYAIAKQFVLKELVRWGVKCFLKISHENVSACPPLFNILAQSFITVVICVSHECMLSVWKKFISIKMSPDMCSSNLQGTQVREAGR